MRGLGGFASQSMGLPATGLAGLPALAYQGMEVKKKAAVQLIGFATGNASASGTTITPPIGTQPGDLLFLVLTRFQGSGQTPSGNAKTWTQVFFNKAGAWYGIATGAGVITINTTFGTDVWQLLVLRGASAVTQRTNSAFISASSTTSVSGFTKSPPSRAVISMADQQTLSAPVCISVGFVPLAPLQVNNTSLQIVGNLDNSYVSGADIVWASLRLAQQTELTTFELT